MTQDDDASRAAATAIIVRDMPGDAPEILMMERAATMAFAAGALVFPGGGVDDRDRALAQQWAGNLAPDEAAARIAAIRETIEESGLGIGLRGKVDAVALLAIRADLLAGEPLGDLLAARGLTLALDDLQPFARWHPSPRERAIRVYDTRFYLVRAPLGQEASVDATENVRLFWSSARTTLTRCDAGDGQVIFPTRRNLERLAQFGSYADLADHARHIPVEKIRPWFEDRNGEPHLCIPAHLGYPVTSEPMRQVRRG